MLKPRWRKTVNLQGTKENYYLAGFWLIMNEARNKISPLAPQVCLFHFVFSLIYLFLSLFSFSLASICLRLPSLEKSSHAVNANHIHRSEGNIKQFQWNIITFTVKKLTNNILENIFNNCFPLSFQFHLGCRKGFELNFA